jgi:hypothetical protein
LNRRAWGPGCTEGPIVQPVPVAEQVEPGATPDIDQLDRFASRSPGERRPEQRGSADLIRLHGASVEDFEKFGSVSEAQVAEQERSRSGRAARVDIGKWVLGATQKEVVGPASISGGK